MIDYNKLVDTIIIKEVICEKVRRYCEDEGLDYIDYLQCPAFRKTAIEDLKDFLEPPKLKKQKFKPHVGAKFKNKEVIGLFRELGFEITEHNNGAMYVIDGKVDVYRNSAKVYFKRSGEWQLTTPDSIVQLITKELKK